jgi:hypothetical protein
MMPLDPIVGGTVLRIPAIQSPNFSLAGQTGWAIFQNGNAYFFNITAQGTITASAFEGTDFVIYNSGEFFYSGTPAAGNLVFSLAPPGVTQDQFGNTVSPVFAIYGTSAGEKIVFSIAGGVATETFSTGVSFEGTSALIKSGTVGAAAAEVIQLIMAGPAANVAGANDLAFMILQSNNEGGTATAEGLLVIQLATSGTLETMLTWAPAGVTLNNLATTKTTLPSTLQGNIGLGQSDVSTTTVTQAAQTQLCAGYSIPASDAAIGSCYRMKTFGTGVQGTTAETLTFAAGIGVLGVAGTGITFPAAFAAISAAFRWSCTVEAICITTGSGGTWRINCEATVTSAAGNQSASSTNTTAIAESTIVSQVLTASAAWGSAAVACTMSSYGSHFEKVV